MVKRCSYTFDFRFSFSNKIFVSLSNCLSFREASSADFFSRPISRRNAVFSLRASDNLSLATFKSASNFAIFAFNFSTDQVRLLFVFFSSFTWPFNTCSSASNFAFFVLNFRTDWVRVLLVAFYSSDSDSVALSSSDSDSDDVHEVALERLELDVSEGSKT